MFGWRIERTSHIDLKGRLQKTQSLRSSHPGRGIDRIETRSSPKGSFAKSRRNYRLPHVFLRMPTRSHRSDNRKAESLH